jgi:transcription elongation factor GreB
MSKAFTKEDDGPEPVVVAPRPPLPPGMPNYVTARGLQLLRDERQALEAERASVLALTDEARRSAVLAQNAARLLELDQRLASAELVRHEPGDVVRFGSRVTVEDAEGRQRQYEIVGVDEAEPESGRIAFSSPLARALLGARTGDDITFQSPGRLRELNVVTIE